MQNKVISCEILALQNQISNLNDLVSSIQTGGGSLQITTLFNSSYHEKYKNFWTFRCSHWDDRIFYFDETATKNTAFCNEENGYSMKFSNSFGWSADVTAVFSDSFQLNDKSILTVDYNCSSDGDGITAEIVSNPDFTSQKTAQFEIIPAFYATNTYLSSNFRLVPILKSENYYLRFRGQHHKSYVYNQKNSCGFGVIFMLQKLSKLVDVKSIVTLFLTFIFGVLALKGSVTADQFLTVFTTIIAFYFGTQYEKTKKGE